MNILLVTTDPKLPQSHGRWRQDNENTHCYRSRDGDQLIVACDVEEASEQLKSLPSQPAMLVIHSLDFNGDSTERSAVQDFTRLIKVFYTTYDIQKAVTGLEDPATLVPIENVIRQKHRLNHAA